MSGTDEIGAAGEPGLSTGGAMAENTGAAGGRSDSDSAGETAPAPPDRLSVNPKSPYFDEALLARGVGIRFKGVEKDNVEEYCISEGWVRLSVGKTLDRHGQPLTMKVTGPVEAYFRT